MTTIKKPCQTCYPKKDLTDYRRLVFTHAPALGRLLDQLDAGIIPNYLELMSAISQSVAYFTEGEAYPFLRDPSGEIPPGSYCPSC